MIGVDNNLRNDDLLLMNVSEAEHFKALSENFVPLRTSSFIRGYVSDKIKRHIFLTNPNSSYVNNGKVNPISRF